MGVLEIFELMSVLRGDLIIDSYCHPMPHSEHVMYRTSFADFADCERSDPPK